MSEIKVGEFVRTKKDGIVKLLEEEIDGSGLWCGTVDKTFWLRENNIVKHSKDIIDLIEVGDYINGSMVYEILEDGRIHIMTGHLLNNKDIKTILTHEQYKQNCYEVEG